MGPSVVWCRLNFTAPAVGLITLQVINDRDAFNDELTGAKHIASLNSPYLLEYKTVDFISQAIAYE